MLAHGDIIAHRERGWMPSSVHRVPLGPLMVFDQKTSAVPALVVLIATGQVSSSQAGSAGLGITVLKDQTVRIL